MTTLKENVEALAKIDIALDEWDTPPVMYVVMRVDGEDKVVDMQIPEAIWVLVPPLQFLRMLAVASTEPTAPDFPLFKEGDDIRGIILRTEAWAIDNGSFAHLGEEGARQAVEELQERMANGYSLSEHPNRIEAKVYSAAGIDEDEIVLLHHRGTSGVVDTNAVGVTGGAVPDALLLAVGALRARFTTSL